MLQAVMAAGAMVVGTLTAEKATVTAEVAIPVEMTNAMVVARAKAMAAERAVPMEVISMARVRPVATKEAAMAVTMAAERATRMLVVVMDAKRAAVRAREEAAMVVEEAMVAEAAKAEEVMVAATVMAAVVTVALRAMVEEAMAAARAMVEEAMAAAREMVEEVMAAVRVTGAEVMAAARVRAEAVMVAEALMAEAMLVTRTVADLAVLVAAVTEEVMETQPARSSASDHIQACHSRTQALQPESPADSMHHQRRSSRTGPPLHSSSSTSRGVSMAVMVAIAARCYNHATCSLLMQQLPCT